MVSIDVKNCMYISPVSGFLSLSINLYSRDTKGQPLEPEENKKADALVTGATPATNKKKVQKREANDSNSSASGPSFTSPTKRARVTKTQTKMVAKGEPSSSRVEDRDSARLVSSYTLS